MAAPIDRTMPSTPSLLRALDALWSVDDPDRLARLIVDEAAGLLPGLVAALAVVGHGAPMHALVVGSEDWCAKEVPLDGSIAGRALRSGLPVEMAAAESSDSGRLLAHEVTTLRAIPLQSRAWPDLQLAAADALLFLSRSPAGFTDEQRVVMDQFARLAGVALERTRLLAQARESASSLKKAFDVAMAMAGARSHRDVIDALLQKAVEALDAERATLSSVEDDGITVQANYTRHGQELTWIGRTYALTYLEHQPYVREALEQRRPVIGGQLNASSAAPEFKEALAAVRHTLTLPLVHGNDVEGMLVLSRAEDRPFAEGDVVTVQLIGSAALLALRNARLFDETERARAESESISRAQRLGIDSAIDVASELTLHDIVSRVVQRAAEVARADRCVLLSVEGDRAVVEGSYGRDGAEAVPAGASLLISQQPLLVEAFATGAATQSPRINLAVLPDGERAVMDGLKLFATVPLLLRGQPIGALNLSRYTEEPFTPEELAALTQIGQITALAVRNARLFEELQVASRSKTEFLNLAAHELRTPISVIKGYMSLLLEESLAELPEVVRQPLKVVQEKATELNAIVEDLLAAARVQAGTIAANPVELDGRAVVERATDRVRPAINLAGGTLTVRLPAKTAVVVCDQGHLERILDNLLNNAVAYSPNAPELAVRVTTARGQLRVEVQDHGRGIPETAQDRIFDQFERVEDARFGYTPGTGLGLYISRGLARRHGGEVELVRSAPGAGSTFALVLPLKRA